MRTKKTSTRKHSGLPIVLIFSKQELSKVHKHKKRNTTKGARGWGTGPGAGGSCGSGRRPGLTFNQRNPYTAEPSSTCESSGQGLKLTSFIGNSHWSSPGSRTNSYLIVLISFLILVTFHQVDSVLFSPLGPYGCQGPGNRPTAHGRADHAGQAPGLSMRMRSSSISRLVS